MPPISPPTAPRPSPPPLHVKPKFGKNILIVGSIVFFALALIVLIILTGIVKTGFLRIPVLSNLYHGPVPTRVVSAEPMSYEKFKSLLEGRMARQVATERPPYVVHVSEQELTGFLQTAIDAGLRDQSWKRIDSQIVVRPTDVEFLSRYVKGAVHMDALVRFIPKVTNGSLMFKPAFVQIGDFSLPPDVAVRIIGYLFARDFGTWTLAFGSVTLQDVRLTDGGVDIVVAAPNQ